MTMIKGITITLINKIEVGRDPFNKPIVEDVGIEVDNVLISPTSTDDIVNQLNIDGKKAVYTLAIPKGDTNNWEDAEVFFFGKRWRTFGIPIEGIEHLIPLDWNKKVMVERYE
jgi:hypothetical protein